MKSLIFLLLHLCFLTQGYANIQMESCTFKEINYSWTGGGAYPRITISNDKIYLISDVSGVWQAPLNSPAWKKSVTGLDNLEISNIEFSKKNPLRGYVTTRAGISTTDNGGLSWSTIKNIPDTIRFRRWHSYRNIAIEPNDPDSFIFGDQLGNIYEYANGRIIDTISTPISSPISSLIIFNNGASLLVGSGENRALYEKRRSVWKLKKLETTTALDFESVTVDGKEVVVSVGSKYVYISDDKANSWFISDISEVVGIGVQVNRVATAVNKNGRLSILISWSKGWQSGILVSTDNGKSWQNPIGELRFVKNNPTRNWKPNSLDRIMSVYIDKKNTDNWYMSTYWGIWHSSDSGKVWNENFKTGAANSVGSAIAIAENGDLITASMDIGLLRYHRNIFTRDVNISTLLPNNKNHSQHKLVAGHFWNILLSGKRMVATNSPWESSANQIVLSEDAGESWQIITDGLPSYYATGNTVWEKGYARALIQDPANKNKLYLGIDGHGLFISYDGGYHWKKSSKQPDNLRIYNGLALDAKENIIYWGTVGGGVYVSRDDGKSWALDGLQNKEVFDLQVTSDGVVYAGIGSTSVSGAAIARKDTINSSWQLLKDFALVGTVEAITIDPKQEKIIVVGINGWSYNNNGTIFISNDAGISWNKISGNFGVGVADMVISPCSNTLYITGYSGGISSINLTPYIK